MTAQSQQQLRKMYVCSNVPLETIISRHFSHSSSSDPSFNIVSFLERSCKFIISWFISSAFRWSIYIVKFIRIYIMQLQVCSCRLWYAQGIHSENLLASILFLNCTFFQNQICSIHYHTRYRIHCYFPVLDDKSNFIWEVYSQRPRPRPSLNLYL